MFNASSRPAATPFQGQSGGVLAGGRFSGGGCPGAGAAAARRAAGGFTIMETAVAAALLTVFLSSLFLLNSVVMRMLRAGNETACASQILQARAEQVRMSNWLDVTSPGFVRDTVLAHDPPTALLLAGQVETISAGPYVFGAAQQPGPAFVFQRDTRAGAVTAAGGNGAALGGCDLVQYTLTVRWTSWGGRTRERSLTTLVSSWGIGQ